MKHEIFHLKPEFFPKTTEEALPVEAVLKYGALLLGFKNTYRYLRPCRYLNIGCLDPRNKGALREIEQIARAHLKIDWNGTHVYQILNDEFIEILKSVYRVPESDCLPFKQS